MEVDDQIRVRFVTKTQTIAVPDTALSLATACGRAQLGDVVNKLRGGSNLDLDFLWDDKHARASTETTDPVVAAGRRTSMLGLGPPLKVLELRDVLRTQSVPRGVLRERPLHELVIPEEVEV